MAILTYDRDRFYLDGEPHTILSGAMHYFRIPREYWYDRLLKLKECGFNTVETYTCWNLHEPREGEFDFSGMLDLEAYVSIAEELGLNVILRPGPYICAEWEFGGLPAWLLTYEKMPLRCNDALYLSKVRRYYTELFRRMVPHLSTNGGGIIMVQIENEYGSFGNDHDYTRAVRDMYRELGVDCLLFTSDGGIDWMLEGGTVDGELAVANFGSRPEMNFEALKKARPDQPLMCGEFWCGWFDHWHEQHHTREPSDYVGDFEKMLEMGASVNYYMFHGGTNFGFMNGANHDKFYQPTITSYDYNSPLSEAGDRTAGYYAVRDAIAKFTGVTTELTASESTKAAYGDIALTEVAPLLGSVDKLGETVTRPEPVYMEELGQSYGWILYSATVTASVMPLPLRFDVLHDRAVVFFDGKLAGILERGREQQDITLPAESGRKVRVDILVENMGRVNYGPKMRDRKGAVGIRFGQQYHFGWDITPMPMTDLSRVEYAPIGVESREGAHFLRGTLEVETPADTFIRLDGFSRGAVWVNGFNLGRYHNSAGPQKTLYCPAPMLKAGKNEIVVLETDGFERPVITSLDTPDLG